MKNILTVIKKELFRFFTDKRMLVSLILPGLMIFVMYSIMGNFMGSAMSADSEHEYVVYTINAPTQFAVFDNSEQLKINISTANKDSIDSIKEKINAKEVDLLIVYEENFYSKMMAYTADGVTKAPDVFMYYNSVDNESSAIYDYYYTCLQQYEAELNNKFDINYGGDGFDLATNEEKSATLITMLLPFLLIIFLFSGCMAIATESIAGEKERGTIATLLVTPIKRSELAIGKITALSITALVGALSSFIGLIASLPKLLNGADISISIYGPFEYLSIFAVIVTTVLLFTVILSMVSAYSKSVKEASAYAMPIMILSMVCGITSMMGVSSSNNALYLIPIYNSTQCMSSIFSLNFNGIQFLITILANLGFVGIGIFILTRMFNSEKIMFNK